jgi:hypothetical protein
MMYNDRSRVSRGAQAASPTTVCAQDCGDPWTGSSSSTTTHIVHFCCVLLTQFPLFWVVARSQDCGDRWMGSPTAAQCAALCSLSSHDLPSRCHDGRCSTFSLRSTRTALVNV